MTAASTTLDAVHAFIADASEIDLHVICQAVESRQDETFAERSKHATIGAYVTIWDADPAYLDTLSGEIVAKDDEDDTVTIQLDAPSAGRLRFNPEARADGWRVPCRTPYQVTVPSCCCNRGASVDSTAQVVAQAGA